jgi:hypothetical protein
VTEVYAGHTLPMPVGRDLPVTSSRITFPRLQHGEYEVWLIRGGDIYGSPTAAVGDRPARLTVNERSLNEELAEQVAERAVLTP